MDLRQQRLVHQSDVVAQRLPSEHLGLRPPGRLGHAENLAHQRVEIGDVFESIPVGAQSQTHHAQHQDVPEVHAGAACAFLLADDGFLQQGENLRVERGVKKQPLQAGEDGRQFIATGEGQTDFLDGQGVEPRLHFESFTHTGRIFL